MTANEQTTGEGSLVDLIVHYLFRLHHLRTAVFRDMESLGVLVFEFFALCFFCCISFYFLYDDDRYYTLSYFLCLSCIPR